MHGTDFMPILHGRINDCAQLSFPIFLSRKKCFCGSYIPLHVFQGGSSQFLSQELSTGCDMDCKVQLMSFDLQLPADLYISLADRDFPNKRNVSDILKYTSNSCAGSISNPVDLTLSLSLGEDSRKREGKKKSLSYPQAVINLEDSTEGVNIDDVERGPSLGFIPLLTSSEGKHESHEFILSDPTAPSCVKQDISHDFTDGSSLVNSHQRCQEQHPYNQGNNDLCM